MSAATKTGREDASKTLELMQEMGAESFDPIPPEQYLCFLNKDLRITPSAQEALAWMRKWTIRGRMGGRSSYAADGPKRPLRLKDMAAELEWSAPFTSRIWAELEDAGLVRKDDKDRLFLCGRVKPRRKMTAEDSIEDELASMTEYERLCSELLPLYAWLQMKKLDPQTRRKAAVEYWEADQYCRRVIADAVGGARAWVDGYREEVLRRYGIKIRRHEPAAEPTQTTVNIEVKAPEKLSVQNFSPDPVQGISDTQYSTSGESVRESYPYETEIDRVDRVSKCEPEAGSGFSCEDLPTPQSEEETPTPAPPPEPEPEPAAATVTPEEKPEPEEKPQEQQEQEPPAARPQEAKNLPVERESTRPTSKGQGPIVAYVEKLFGKGQSPVILMKFETLAAEFQITPEAVTHFLLEKVEDKIRNNYPIKSAGALHQFARADLAGWIAQNRRELSHGARQDAAAYIPAPMPPAEELIQIEQWLCHFAKHPDAEATRARIAELRAQLGDAAPPPFQLPTPEEEIARLEAIIKQEIERQGPNALLDPFVKSTRAKIRKLKQELGSDAAGAGAS